MPFQNDQERFAVFMLEDLRPSQCCDRCEDSDGECTIFCFGRACYDCERRLDSNCYLLKVNSWRHYYHDALSPLDFIPQVFGRDMYSVFELQPYVPRAFKYLCRGYFNVVKAQYTRKLASITDLEHLNNILVMWMAHGYTESALRLIRKRLVELGVDVSLTGVHANL
ncbi:hypothetical protein C8R44DRAFT_878794 [Mycena epipterygia]|nr:hypothetical protein C8R44DRAFT_878794 [Mycena epipterygia]